MAIPPVGNIITPALPQAVSAQGQVIISWNLVPFATSYFVSRSDDNVTFAELGSVNAPFLQYTDLTGVVNQVYYYYIQASDGTNSSLPTRSVAAQSLKPGQVTLGNLRLICQQRTDLQYSENVKTQEWNSMISQSYKELWDILAQKFGDDYFVATPYIYSTVANQTLYPLPDDFKALLGAECSNNTANPNAWITMRQIEFIDRNMYATPGMNSYMGPVTIPYRLNGNNLYLPNPMGGNQTIRIWYVPRPNQLINDQDIVDGVAGWEEYIVADVSVKVLAKQEQDPTIFAIQKQQLMSRIEEAAENRNIGEPQRVSDSGRGVIGGPTSWNGWYR